MITENDEGLIDHTKLEGIEIVIFRKFLEMEKKRHEEDIQMIDMTLSEMASPSDNSRKVEIKR